MPKRKPSAKTAPTDALVGLILDRSGSMGSWQDATIEGINSLLADQRAEDGTAYVSTTLFNTDFDVVHVATDVREVPDFDRDTYRPSGGTALYDAVGVTVEGLDLWLANHPEFVGKVAVVIWTDGEENSSRRYHLATLMALIEARQKAGWDFMFLGTGGSAWTEGTRFAQTIGVHQTAAVVDSARGVRASYAGASQSLSSLRASGAAEPIAAAYAAAMADDDESESED